MCSRRRLRPRWYVSTSSGCTDGPGCTFWERPGVEPESSATVELFTSSVVEVMSKLVNVRTGSDLG